MIRSGVAENDGDRDPLCPYPDRLRPLTILDTPIVRTCTQMHASPGRSPGQPELALQRGHDLRFAEERLAVVKERGTAHSTSYRCRRCPPLGPCDPSRDRTQAQTSPTTKPFSGAGTDTTLTSISASVNIACRPSADVGQLMAQVLPSLPSSAQAPTTRETHITTCFPQVLPPREHTTRPSPGAVTLP
jgi:hypothetical protein